MTFCLEVVWRCAKVNETYSRSNTCKSVRWCVEDTIFFLRSVMFCFLLPGTIPEVKSATPVANTSTTNASLQNAVPEATNVPRLKLMLQWWMKAVVKFHQKRSKGFRRNYSTSRSTSRVFNQKVRASSVIFSCMHEGWVFLYVLWVDAWRSPFSL